MNNTETAEDYRGYTIHEISRYYFGTPYKYSDWEVYHGDQEKGTLFHCKTLSEVKQAIDEMVEENIIE